MHFQGITSIEYVIAFLYKKAWYLIYSIKLEKTQTLALVIVISLFFLKNNLFAQACTGGTPSYSINLTGNNDSIWTSGSITRAGNCCSSNNCVEFNVTIDNSSNGIKLEIISGAVPGGSLNYTISCGTPQSFGQAVCLTGVGPHRITFCKPGNNANVYRITAIPKPNITGSVISSLACGVYLKTEGFQTTGLTWNSVPNNATYNSFLSCSANCDSVNINTGSIALPITINYRACGTVIGGCSNTTTCDTTSVTILNNPSVSIIPDSVKVCYGATLTTVSTSVTGGLAPYNYVWSGGGTSSTKSVGVGTHYLAVTDALGCYTARDTTVVTTFSGPFEANAGNDTAICSVLSSINLNGQVQIASGGTWSGGLGTFSPNDSTLNATYSPTNSEKATGFVNLLLSTKNSFSCSNITDTVKITFNPAPTPVITGDTLPCSSKVSIYSTPAVAANTYLWSATGGLIIGSNTNNNSSIQWGNTSSGIINLTQTTNLGCAKTISQNITILPIPNGSILYHY